MLFHRMLVMFIKRLSTICEKFSSLIHRFQLFSSSITNDFPKIPSKRKFQLIHIIHMFHVERCPKVGISPLYRYVFLLISRIFSIILFYSTKNSFHQLSSYPHYSHVPCGTFRILLCISLLSMPYLPSLTKCSVCEMVLGLVRLNWVLTKELLLLL